MEWNIHTHTLSCKVSRSSCDLTPRARASTHVSSGAGASVAWVFSSALRVSVSAIFDASFPSSAGCPVLIRLVYDGDKSSATDADRSRFIDPEAVDGVGTVSAMVLPGERGPTGGFQGEVWAKGRERGGE